MIRALVIGLMQSTNRASAGILIQNFNFGRNTGNEDHGTNLLLGFRFSAEGGFGVSSEHSDT